MVFRERESRVTRTIAESWPKNLVKIFELAGPFEEPPKGPILLYARHIQTNGYCVDDCLRSFSGRDVGV